MHSTLRISQRYRLVLLTLTIVLIASCTNYRTSSLDKADSSLEIIMNRVVYVGSNGNIFTIDPDGSNSKRLTDNVQAGSRGVILGQALQPNSLFYTWPTWAPDGTRLAASQVVITNGLPEVSLLVLDPNTGQMNLIYENRQRTSPIIAQNVPHYMYWSPNSRHLAFIASAEEGLTLYIHGYGEEKLAFSDLGPLYFKWSCDSQSLLVHARDKLMSSELPFTEDPLDLGEMSPIFRTPDLSPDGTTIVYLSKNTEEALLISSARY